MTPPAMMPVSPARLGFQVDACKAPPNNLDFYTDPDVMRLALETQLPQFAQGSLRIDALAVSNVRRNTSRTRNPNPMTLCYQLDVCNPASGQSGALRLYGQVFRDPAAAAAAVKDHAHVPLVAPRFGEALVHLPLLNLVLWALPNDPGLPQLAKLLDPVQVAAAWPSALGTVDGAAVQVELLRYEPQHRATLRYTIANAVDPTPRTVYVKTFRDDRAAAIHQRFTYFWQLAQSNPHAPLVAQPMAVDPLTQTHWQAPAIGAPLTDCLSTPAGANLMAQLGRALATLHAAPLAPMPRATPRSVAHWVAEARRRQKKLGRISPHLASVAAQIADAIEAHAVHPSTRPLTLIHGDFHPQQVWVHDGRIVLFDFDEFTYGDPMEDLAEFVLKLEQDDASRALPTALVEAYAAAAPDRFDHRCLAWHLTVQSLLQASRAFVYQKPGWREALDRRLAASLARAAALTFSEVKP